MALRDRLNSTTQQMPGEAAAAFRGKLYEKYGFGENPFPAAGQPFGHTRLEDDIDGEIAGAIQEFEREDLRTQVLVIEGTQGVGKTNLLNYYEQELKDCFGTDKGFYIIRYYSDPEPSFDSILRKIFQALGEEHLVVLGEKLAKLDDNKRGEVIGVARSHEIRVLLSKLSRAAGASGEEINGVSATAIEWLVGLRLLKKHRDDLGVTFRLDTVESKTQALRDVVSVSRELHILRGIFLLLDELEKQDYSLSKTPVLRYLSAIRALIDALPTNLFLVLALTREARRRYFSMLPALASRLQRSLDLQGLQNEQQAVALYRHYLEDARKRAKEDPRLRAYQGGKEDPLSEQALTQLFEKLSQQSTARGIKGVTQRDFLHRLHEATAECVNGNETLGYRD